MLFPGAPVDITTSVGGSTLIAGDATMRGNYIYARGVGRYVVVYDSATGTNFVVKSADAGATWAQMDPSSAYVPPGSGNWVVARAGNVLYIGTHDGADFYVSTFDMSTDTFTSLSSPVTGIETDGSAYCLANGDFYVTFSDNSSSGGLSHKMYMRRYSSGSWSSAVVVDSGRTAVAIPHGYGCLDSAGDLHLTYDLQSSTFPFPHTCKHVKISGLTVGSATTAISSSTSETQVWDAIAFDGHLYLAAFGPPYTGTQVIESDSDTSPASWTSTQIETGSGSSSEHKFAIDAASNELYLFWRIPVSPFYLYYSILSAGSWSTPAIAYQLDVNPPSNAPLIDQRIENACAVCVGSGMFGVSLNMTGNTPSEPTQAYYLTNESGVIVLTAARYRVRS